jgi:hypothetical protein
VPDIHIINAILVRLQPGGSPPARNIKDWLTFRPYHREEIGLMLKGAGGHDQATLLFRTLLMIVSVVIISLVIYTLPWKRSAYRVMKLIGASIR